MSNFMHPYCKVKILLNGRALTIPISDLFIRSSIIRAQNNGSKICDPAFLNMSTIYNTPVLIQDNTGWTELISMALSSFITADKIEFTEIKVADKRTLLSNDYKVPTYDLNKQSIGFHGEVKYETIPKKVCDLTTDDYLRVYRGKSEYDTTVEFAHPSEITPKATIADGYLIMTKSDFFNLDGIVMLA